jgi:hypothetical protein
VSKDTSWYTSVQRRAIVTIRSISATRLQHHVPRRVIFRKHHDSAISALHTELQRGICCCCRRLCAKNVRRRHWICETQGVRLAVRQDDGRVAQAPSGQPLRPASPHRPASVRTTAFPSPSESPDAPSATQKAPCDMRFSPPASHLARISKGRTIPPTNSLQAAPQLPLPRVRHLARFYCGATHTATILITAIVPPHPRRAQHVDN